MLGHVELSTPQIDTQISIRRLGVVHALTHPSAKMDRPTKSNTTAANGAGDATPADILRCPTYCAFGEHANVGFGVSSGEASTKDLLAALDAEADEEHEDERLES